MTGRDWNELLAQLRVELAKAEADAEAHRMRCVSLETQLATAKRAELESDRRAHEAILGLEAERLRVGERLDVECSDWLAENDHFCLMWDGCGDGTWVVQFQGDLGEVVGRGETMNDAIRAAMARD